MKRRRIIFRFGLGVAIVLLAGAVAIRALFPQTRDGFADAQRDIDGGRLIIMTGGLPAPWIDDFKAVLRERHDIRLQSGAGCVVTSELKGYLTNYNEVMEKEIVRRFGINAVSDAALEAQSRFESKRGQSTGSLPP